ncbi:hypothetical protein [Rhodoferax sp.]|uniref:hypothetical protein n=1 Tax=Rhodoferax sp. TaxID=50421 RepID=UPI0025DF5526|nr:hypothetical protein [Rhodoferax sp.]
MRFFPLLMVLASAIILPLPSAAQDLSASRLERIKPGSVVAVAKGTLHEPGMKEKLKSAQLLVLDPIVAP